MTTNIYEIQDDRKHIFTGDFVLELSFTENGGQGKAGIWDADRSDDGYFEFGMASDFSVGTNWTEDKIIATCSIGGIQAHGSKIAFNRIRGYAITADLARRVEELDGFTYDEVVDELIEKAQRYGSEIDGLILHDLRRTA